jgi:hypothetical protein
MSDYRFLPSRCGDVGGIQSKIAHRSTELTPKSKIHNWHRGLGVAHNQILAWADGGLGQARVKFWLTGLSKPVEVVNPLDAIPETAL